MDKEKSILQEAEEIVNGDRKESYGDAKTSFDNIASGWSVIAGKEITGHQVALMMAWLKIVRENNSHKKDNLTGLIGYAFLANKIV